MDILSAIEKAQELFEVFQSVDYALMCVEQLEKLEGKLLGYTFEHFQKEAISYSSEFWWEVRKELRNINK